MKNLMMMIVVVVTSFAFNVSNTYAIVPSGMHIQFSSGLNENIATDLIRIRLGKYKEQTPRVCTGIFAICPDQSYAITGSCNYTGMELCVKIIHDGNEPLPFQLHLIEDPSTFDDPVEDFLIYEDILIPVIGMPFNLAVIEAGVYPFDPTIGMFGGYSIDVIGTD